MSTLREFGLLEIKQDHQRWSEMKGIIETSFYGNNVQPVSDLTEAYHLAKEVPGTIVTDHPVLHTQELGLPKDARVLVYNDGKVVGRTSAARRINGEPGFDQKKYAQLLREAVYLGSRKQFYSGEVVVGLDSELMLRSHLMVPVEYANTLYSYLLNFQPLTDQYQELYQQSCPLPENDLYIYGDPDWHHPAYPNGLAIFDPVQNVAAILGLRYFGEFKKATLTLAWATAKRNNFIPCHGGIKQFSLPDKKYTLAAFGLSGSGKSTITLATNETYPVKVLHDDAFVINRTTGATTALEPAYFDKTQDYPLSHPGVAYFVTCQNVGVTLNEAGEKVLVTEDIRNGNGRTVKSRFVTPNRVDHLAEPLDAIFWIMKDDSLPPVLKLDNPGLAAVFGATLATKRSTAENILLPEADLIIEPYANPFRAYKLAEDYESFRDLFETKQTACYILNTGEFKGIKVTPSETLSSIEKIVTETGDFQAFGSLQGFSYLPLENHPVDFYQPSYLSKLIERMKIRLDYVLNQNSQLAGYNRLPQEASALLETLIIELEGQLVKQLNKEKV